MFMKERVNTDFQTIFLGDDTDSYFNKLTLFPPLTTYVFCSLVCLCVLIAYMATNMDQIMVHGVCFNDKK